jgi:hypothetical protein
VHQARGITSVGDFDCPGRRQVVVNGTTAYISHTSARQGTRIVATGRRGLHIRERSGS